MKFSSIGKKMAAAVLATTLAVSAFGMPAMAMAAPTPVTFEAQAKVKTTKITSLTKVVPVGFTVKWSKSTDAKCTGYQIRYSTSSKMKSAKKVDVNKRTTASKTVKDDIKASTKYYVQVRVVTTVNGKQSFSAWSATKSLVTSINSGDKAFDKSINNILAKDIKAEGEAGLLKSFDYIVAMKYKPSTSKPVGAWQNWSVKAAKRMISKKGGNCYDSASLMTWLARGLGYDAKAISGVFNKTQQHGWCELKIAGKTKIYDPDGQRTWNKSHDNAHAMYKLDKARNAALYKAK